MLVLDYHLVMVQRREVQFVPFLDLVELVEFRRGNGNPPPLGVSLVVNGNVTVSVHGGISCLYPLFLLLVGKRGIALSAPSANGNVHRACVGEVAKGNVVRPLVGVNVPR